MTAPSSIDPARFLHDQLESASPDLLRSMLTAFINALMSAEADAVCGAPYGLTGPERVNVRNGCRHRDFDTRAGTLDVAIPKLRSGSYFPDWLLERRRRAEAACREPGDTGASQAPKPAAERVPGTARQDRHQKAGTRTWTTSKRLICTRQRVETNARGAANIRQVVRWLPVSLRRDHSK